jgi:bacterioferritin
MDNKELLSKLNWLFNFARNMEDLYEAQSKAFEGTYESIVFERMSYLEQQHVANIGDKIQELGGRPTKSGNVIAPIIKLTGHTDSLEDILKADILVERKLMNDYTDLINLVGDDYGTELKKILQHNLGDEDVHTAWFAQRLSDYDNLDLLH